MPASVSILSRHHRDGTKYVSSRTIFTSRPFLPGTGSQVAV